jgi:uncharacterized DUF497 family protein
MAFIFQSDKRKGRLNLVRHEVSFEEASTVFGDPFSRTIDDPLHSEDEDRYVIIGQSVRERLLVVVHTKRGDSIRIVSACIATPTERRQHEEGS